MIYTLRFMTYYGVVHHVQLDNRQTAALLATVLRKSDVICNVILLQGMEEIPF